MITPRTTSLKGARADFEALVPVDRVHIDWKGEDYQMNIWAAPDGQAVGMLLMTVPLLVADAEALWEEVAAPEGSHVVLRADAYETGFEEAFEAASHGAVTLTLLDHSHMKEIRELHASVPKPEPAPAVAVTFTISEWEFDMLACGSSMRGDAEFAERVFEPYLTSMHGITDGMELVRLDWAMMYFFAEDAGFADVKMAMAFLDGQKADYELVADGDGTWCLLTDFKTASWKHSDLVDEEKKRRELAKAREAGDDLMVAYLAPDAEKENN